MASPLFAQASSRERDPNNEGPENPQTSHKPEVKVSPTSAKKDEAVKVTAKIPQPVRRDPDHFIKSFKVSLDDTVLVEGEATTGLSDNPIIEVKIKATKSGTVKFQTTCNLHGPFEGTAQLTVA